MITKLLSIVYVVTISFLLTGCAGLTPKPVDNTSEDFLDESAINVSQTERGVEIRIQEMLLFDTGKSTLKPISAKLLDKTASIINDKTKKDVAIEGHTDNVGTKQLNMKLSAERAEAVKNALIARGVDEKRMKVAGFDFQKPIADNKTKSGRAKNRRVEIYLLDEQIEKMGNGEGMSAFGGLFDVAGAIFKGITGIIGNILGNK